MRHIFHLKENKTKINKIKSPWITWCIQGLKKNAMETQQVVVHHKRG
jgi:hypothetical protein